MVLENTTESPLDSKRTTLSTPKETNPEYSLEALILKHQYFGHLMQRANSLDKTLILGKIEALRSSGQQRMKWLDGMGLRKWALV